MSTSDTDKKGTAGAQQGMIASFLRWYFAERPGEIASAYKKYASAFIESFALKFMAKTLFSPWKKITDDYPGGGFNFEAIASTFFLNVTSRAIGFVIRIVTIATGLIIQIALLAGFAVYLLLWMLFPLIAVLSIPILLMYS